VSYLGYIIVGAGSTAFHATLKCELVYSYPPGTSRRLTLRSQTRCSSSTSCR
jgi:hypothetical protein